MDEEIGEYYFSVMDVVGAICESKNPRRYWSGLKRKLKKEGSQLYENIVQLEMESTDGKYFKAYINKDKLLYALFHDSTRF